MKGIARWLDPNYKLDRKQIPRVIPFILYITFWAILYIANTHYAEKTVRQIGQVNKQLKELSADYLTIKSELMYKSKQSEVAKMVQPSGLKELKSPPKKIVADLNEH